jgi:hypothetical protein
MTAYTTYEVASGNILKTGTCPDNAVELQRDNASQRVVAEPSNPLTDYVKNGKVVPRQEMKLKVTGARIEWLPIPCYVTVDRKVYHVLDGAIDFTANLPGEYRLVIDAPGFLSHAIVIGL